MKLTLNNVRLTFSQNLFTPGRVNEDSDPRYSSSFLLEKSHPQVPEIVKAMQAEATAKWGQKAGVMFKSLKAQDRLCLHDGDTKAQYAGYEGNLFVNAGHWVEPLVVDRNPRIKLTEADNKVYSGCYVNAIIDVVTQDNKWGQRINARLLGVQFAQDGERLAGGPGASADEFQVLPGAENDTVANGFGDATDTTADPFAASAAGGDAADSDADIPF